MSNQQCPNCKHYFTVSGFYDHEPHCSNEAAKASEQSGRLSFAKELLDNMAASPPPDEAVYLTEQPDERGAEKGTGAQETGARRTGPLCAPSAL